MALLPLQHTPRQAIQGKVQRFSIRPRHQSPARFEKVIGWWTGAAHPPLELTSDKGIHRSAVELDQIPSALNPHYGTMITRDWPESPDCGIGSVGSVCSAFQTRPSRPSSSVLLVLPVSPSASVGGVGSVDSVGSVGSVDGVNGIGGFDGVGSVGGDGGSNGNSGSVRLTRPSRHSRSMAAEATFAEEATIT